jgi:uncharacterized membrane protein YphA (DoxX/SURF4 family)
MIPEIKKLIARMDDAVITFLGKYALPMARLAFGVIFIWFGGLKVLDLSPAYDLVAATVYWLTPEVIVPLIGLWEVAIGVCLLYPPLTRIGMLLLAGQMPATFLPLVMLPEVCFTVWPLGLTLEGQYIIKNLAVISAAFIIGGSVKPKHKMLSARGSLS